MASQSDTELSAQLHNAALRLLARREHSRRELATKLAARFRREPDCQSLIVGVLDALENGGLLSEQRYAESLCRQLIERGLGPQRIEQEMRQRGVTLPLNELVAAAVGEVDWQAQARQVFARRFAEPLPQEDRAARQRERARRARFMQYRGFAPDLFMPLLDG